MRVVAFGAALALAVGVVHGQASAPASGPATTPRDATAILQDMQSVSLQLKKLVGTPQTLVDTDKGKELAPQAIPLLKRMHQLMGELGGAHPELKPTLVGQQLQVLALLSLLGDADAGKALVEAAKSPDKPTARLAKLAQSLTQYWQASKDPTAQKKVVAAVTALGAEAEAKPVVRETLTMMANMGAADETVKKAIEAAVASLVRTKQPPATTRAATTTTKPKR